MVDLYVVAAVAVLAVAAFVWVSNGLGEAMRDEGHE